MGIYMMTQSRYTFLRLRAAVMKLGGRRVKRAGREKESEWESDACVRDRGPRPGGTGWPSKEEVGAAGGSDRLGLARSLSDGPVAGPVSRRLSELTTVADTAAAAAI